MMSTRKAILDADLEQLVNSKGKQMDFAGPEITETITYSLSEITVSVETKKKKTITKKKKYCQKRTIIE